MSDRVLFVDDDQMLLSSIERCLGLRYDIETALSGPDALKKIEESGPYRVVVTDMRMPIMDGVEFLGRAREIAPDSIYMMLTGNQDLDTATRAVNEGRVFQLLNKPCDPEEIAGSIDLAFRRHELNRSERELFRSTRMGALAIADDVIERLRPDWTKTIARSQRITQRLREGLGLEACEEFPLAARIAPIGFAMLPIEEAESFAASLPGSPESEETLSRALSISAQILGHLPQLAEVTEMIRLVPRSDGAFVENGDGDDRIRQGAALLRAAYLLDGLLEHGVGVEEAKETIASIMPGASSSFLQAIAEAYSAGDETAEGGREPHEAAIPGVGELLGAGSGVDS